MVIRRLWRKSAGRWIACGTVTFGSFCLTVPGTYKVNTYQNGFWSQPRIFTLTQKDLSDATWAPGKVGEHGFGIEV